MAGRPRAALLVPMPMELRPVVRAAKLRRSSGPGPARHEGRIGGWDVVAAMTGIGTARARSVAADVLDGGPIEHVVVVGIAGAVGEAHRVGEAIDPVAVVDAASGRTFAPHPVGLLVGRSGTLLTGDDLIRDPAHLAALEADGVVVLDMETAAVAAVCEEQGVPWSVARAISDVAGDDVVGATVEGGLATADGQPDLRAVLRYVGPRPWRVAGLARVANQAQRAARAAAELAVASLRAVG